MSDLLKEAIADAKAVRETALQNAKLALEEAFTPQLKSMLSAKLREEEDEEVPGEEIPAEEGDEFGDEEVPAEEIPAEEGDEFEDEEVPMEDEELGGEEEVPYEEDEEIGDEEVPVPAEESDEEGEEDNLDLEAVIKELEDELDGEEEPVEEQDDAYDEKASPGRDGLAEEDGEDDEVEVDESIFNEEEEEDEEPVEEQSDSSKIGNGENTVDVADGKDEEDPEGQGVKKVDFSEGVYKELKEYKEAVRFLKDKLHEVNILNAKLLFTNKLFKEFALNNNQKLKVVETFDRAQTTREIKLVYSTLAEQFGDNGSIGKKRSISESASKPVGSTKPSKASRKVISEEAQVANRFRKLAGIIKG
tara:strand:- start:213 stop:1295 length:1083 start_codon:yes stop_codon:yes gene_type:complete